MEERDIRGLHIAYFPPTGPDRKAVVIGSHGFLSSIKELGKILPEKLSAAGFHVFLYDHFGHGQSSGPRGFVDVPGLIAGFWEVRNHAQTSLKDPSMKFFGLGHSLGTIPVLLHANHLNGVVVVSPMRRLDDSLNRWEKLLYPILYYGVTLPLNFVAQLMGLDWELRIPYKFTRYHLFSEHIYADQAELDLEAYTPARNYALTRVVDNEATASTTRTPVLMIVGKQDIVTGVVPSQQIYNALPAPDKTLKILDRSGHSVFQDHQGHVAIDTIVQWLVAHS